MPPTSACYSRMNSGQLVAPLKGKRDTAQAGGQLKTRFETEAQHGELATSVAAVAQTMTKLSSANANCSAPSSRVGQIAAQNLVECEQATPEAPRGKFAEY
jgi:hypothetical protein